MVGHGVGLEAIAPSKEGAYLVRGGYCCCWAASLVDILAYILIVVQ